jgi:hypothetical protein
MVWTNWIGHGVVLLSFGLAVVFAVASNLWHRAQTRRSPLKRRKVGHLPGQQLLSRISHHDEETLTSLNLMVVALPAMFMVWATMRIDWDQVRWGSLEWVFAFGAALMFLWGAHGYVRHYRRRNQAKDGWIAEQVTGIQLNRLVSRDCLVLHDLPGDGFNIDHVVIAPRGVYAIETKSYRKPRNASERNDDPSHRVTYDGNALRFPDFLTKRPIEQASRQAEWLRRLLRSEHGLDVPVIAAVALPGWFVVRTESGKRAEVVVFTPMGRGAEFMAWQPERIPIDQRRIIAQALATRYPALED